MVAAADGGEAAGVRWGARGGGGQQRQTVAKRQTCAMEGGKSRRSGGCARWRATGGGEKTGARWGATDGSEAAVTATGGGEAAGVRWSQRQTAAKRRLQREVAAKRQARAREGGKSRRSGRCAMGNDRWRRSGGRAREGSKKPPAACAAGAEGFVLRCVRLAWRGSSRRARSCPASAGTPGAP